MPYQKKAKSILARWLSWLEQHSIHQKVVGLIPGQGTNLYHSLTLGQGAYGRQQINVSLTLISLSPAPQKSIKHILGWGLKNVKSFKKKNHHHVPELWVEMELFHEIARNPKSPSIRDCDVARFSQVEICPWVYHVPSPSALPWKTSDGVFNKAKTKGQGPEFVSYQSFVLWEPVQSAVGPSSFCTCMVTCSQVRQKVQVTKMSAGHWGAGGEKEILSELLSPGIILTWVWVWYGPGAFSK